MLGQDAFADVSTSPFVSGPLSVWVWMAQVSPAFSFDRESTLNEH